MKINGKGKCVSDMVMAKCPGSFHHADNWSFRHQPATLLSPNPSRNSLHARGDWTPSATRRHRGCDGSACSYDCCQFRSSTACHRQGAPNMKIVVIGGTGLIGSKTVAILRQGGNEVVAASPKKGINAVTGEGLKDAVAGATVVVDLANSPSFDDRAVMEFFETSGRNLLAAEAAASVRHHVALTIVGTARTRDNGYFRAKVAQEIL